MFSIILLLKCLVKELKVEYLWRAINFKNAQRPEIIQIMKSIIQHVLLN